MPTRRRAQVEGIGSDSAREIHEFLHRSEVRRTLDRLLDVGLEVRDAEVGEQAPLDGMTFVFTGALERFSRDEVKDLVQGAGARVTSSVSGETDCVVVGEDPGSKLDEAEERGVRTVDEESFVKMLSARGVAFGSQ